MFQGISMRKSNFSKSVTKNQNCLEPDWRIFHCGNCILKLIYQIRNHELISWFFCKMIFCNLIMKETIYFLVTRYFGHFKKGKGKFNRDLFLLRQLCLSKIYNVYDLDSILCDRSCCILALLYIITYTFLLRLIILFLLSAFTYSSNVIH